MVARKKALKQLSFICVPVLVNGNPVGGPGVDLRYKPDRDYEQTSTFLSIIASMIAQAIKVSHLLEADKQRLLDENIHLKQELRERYDFSHIVGNLSFLIFHLPFVGLLFRVRSCDFVDRSHLSAKQTIHKATRRTTK